MFETHGNASLEAELVASAASFRAMAENVPGALFRYVMHPDGRYSVRYMSPRCVDLWELQRAGMPMPPASPTVCSKLPQLGLNRERDASALSSGA